MAQNTHNVSSGVCNDNTYTLCAELCTRYAHDMHHTLCLRIKYSDYYETTDHCSLESSINSYTECATAAQSLGYNIGCPTHAGDEWNHGCLVHGGAVYFSPGDPNDGGDGSTNSYICTNTPSEPYDMGDFESMDGFVGTSNEGSGAGDFFDVCEPEVCAQHCASNDACQSFTLCGGNCHLKTATLSADTEVDSTSSCTSYRQNCVPLVLMDTYGDGWNGAKLTINGVDYEVDYEGWGSPAQYSSSACVEDLGCNTMTWTSGSFDGETSWTWGTESGSAGEHPASHVGDCVTGCLAENALNYNADADIADVALCEYAAAQGCMDTSACNYDTSAEEDDDSCTYPHDGLDCAGECLSGVLLALMDTYGDGWNGAKLTINGVDYEVDYEGWGSPAQYSSSACVEYLDCNTMTWTPGSYDGETSWTWGTESGSNGQQPSSPVPAHCDSGTISIL